MKFFVKSFFAFLVLVSIFIGKSCADKKPVAGPNPSWLEIPAHNLTKKPSSKDIAGGFYYSLYEHQVNVSSEEYYWHTIKDIVSDAGVQGNSELNIQFVPEYQKLTIHHITVYRGSEKIEKFDLKKIKIIQNEEDLSRFIYNGFCSVYIILDDIRKGDRIDYAFTIRGSNPVFQNKYDDIFNVYFETAVMNYYLKINAPADRKILYKTLNDVVSPVISVKNNIRSYLWSIQNMKKYSYEGGEPSWYIGHPQIQLTEYATWADVVSWALPLNDYDHIVSASIRTKANELMSQVDSDYNEYVTRAIRFVQDEIRYMGVEIGQYSHRPNSPDKVLQQRYGDCKDKSLLLCALLKAANIDAQVAYVNAYTKSYIDRYLPSPSVFNHCIATFNMYGKRYWIDPTISYQRGSLLTNYCPDYDAALVVKKGVFNLAEIPPSLTGFVNMHEKYTVSEDNTEPAVLEVTTVYTKNFADDIRGLLYSGSMTQTEEMYLDYYKQLYKGVEIEDSLFISDDAVSNSVRVVEKYRITDLWEKDEENPEKLRLRAVTKHIYNQFQNIGKANRKAPLSLRFPYQTNYTVELIMPDTWALNLKPVNINNSVFDYSFIPQLNDNVVTLEYALKIKSDHVPVSMMDQYSIDMEKVAADSMIDFSWDKKVEKDMAAATGVNWWIVLLSVVVCGGCAFLFSRLNSIKIKNRPSVDPDYIEPIGGGLVFLGLMLILRPPFLLFSIIKEGFFGKALWSVLSYQNSSILQSVIIMEVIINTIYFACSIWLLILFFKRKYIFRKAFLYVSIFYLCTMIIDTIIVNIASADTSASVNYGTFAGGIIFVLIWIPYLFRSQRAENTFVYPLPENVNDEMIEGMNERIID